MIDVVTILEVAFVSGLASAVSNILVYELLYKKWLSKLARRFR